MTVDIEKLKALALAMPPGPLTMHRGEICYRSDENDQSYGMRCPVNLEAVLNFITVANPAAVLELIAEVERLRAAPAASHQVLNDEQIIAAWDAQWRTHGHEPCKMSHLDFGRTVESMVTSRCRAEGGDTSENTVAPKQPKNASKNAEIRMDSGFHGGAELPDFAAGTVEKDAARYRWLCKNSSIGTAIYSLQAKARLGKAVRFPALEGESIDSAIDAAIEAHNIAGKTDT